MPFTEPALGQLIGANADADIVVSGVTAAVSVVQEADPMLIEELTVLVTARPIAEADPAQRAVVAIKQRDAPILEGAAPRRTVHAVPRERPDEIPGCTGE